MTALHGHGDQFFRAINAVFLVNQHAVGGCQRFYQQGGSSDHQVGHDNGLTICQFHF